jgi:hypothetical protein
LASNSSCVIAPMVSSLCSFSSKAKGSSAGAAGAAGAAALPQRPAHRVAQRGGGGCARADARHAAIGAGRARSPRPPESGCSPHIAQHPHRRTLVEMRLHLIGQADAFDIEGEAGQPPQRPCPPRP